MIEHITTNQGRAEAAVAKAATTASAAEGDLKKVL
jgi:hypothetical protein